MKTLFYTCMIIGLSLQVSAIEVQSKAWTAHKNVSSENVYQGFGCVGENISPDLRWSDAPKGTKSYAIMMYDPDAPTGSGWWHWIVFDIPATRTSLNKGVGSVDMHEIANGIKQNKNDYGDYGYGGPCPPVGDQPHRYQLTVHALDVEKLPIPEGASGALAGFYINQRTLDKATVTNQYSRVAPKPTQAP